MLEKQKCSSLEAIKDILMVWHSLIERTLENASKGLARPGRGEKLKEGKEQSGYKEHAV